MDCREWKPVQLLFPKALSSSYPMFYLSFYGSQLRSATKYNDIMSSPINVASSSVVCPSSTNERFLHPAVWEFFTLFHRRSPLFMKAEHNEPFQPLEKDYKLMQGTIVLWWNEMQKWPVINMLQEFYSVHFAGIEHWACLTTYLWWSSSYNYFQKNEVR